jgi:hypothetical protein
MFGKNTRMNQLEARKQLLIAESEINRLQLAAEWKAMADDLRSVTHKARNLGTLAMAATSFVSGLISFRRAKPAPAGEKLSRWKTVLKGAQLVGSLWLEFSRPPKS